MLKWSYPLQWRHNGCDGISNHQPQDCLLNRLFRRRSKKTSKLRVTGLCVVYSPVTGEFPAQMASNAENVSIWWRHHGFEMLKGSSTAAETHVTFHGNREILNPYLQVLRLLWGLVVRYVNAWWKKTLEDASVSHVCALFSRYVCVFGLHKRILCLSNFEVVSMTSASFDMFHEHYSSLGFGWYVGNRDFPAMETG